MDDARASSRVGKIDASLREWDIPVIFQAAGETEDEAAEKVGYAVGHAPLIDPDNGIESWYFPNHKEVDGNDIPVRVVIVVDKEKMAERRAIVADIERAVE